MEKSPFKITEHLGVMLMDGKECYDKQVTLMERFGIMFKNKIIVV